MPKTAREQRHDDVKAQQLAAHEKNIVNVPGEIVTETEASTTKDKPTTITIEQVGSVVHLTAGKETVCLGREQVFGLLRNLQKVASIL